MTRVRNKVKNSYHKVIVNHFRRLSDEDRVCVFVKLLQAAELSIEINNVKPMKTALDVTWAITTAVVESYSKSIEDDDRHVMSERERALKEIDDFYANVPKLLKKYRGKYVAYADGKVYESGENEGEVAEAFFKKFGRKPVCIAKVEPEEPTYYLPSPLLPA